jgi:transitional endoplasmic reticulum ATPase
MLFAEAAQATPALIVIEDLDRCYPLNSEKHAEAKISLQQLLNHLDGVGSQNGIVVVATANNPAILDPAILRRPGRFDRVVGFQNPSTELRERRTSRHARGRPTGSRSRNSGRFTFWLGSSPSKKTARSTPPA